MTGKRILEVVFTNTKTGDKCIWNVPPGIKLKEILDMRRLQEEWYGRNHAYARWYYIGKDVPPCGFEGK